MIYNSWQLSVFCLNLIQRRQIDGLVKRVAVTDTGAGAINAAGCGMQIPARENSRNEQENLSAAIQVLDSLKPYFRVVRGSGLY